MPNCDVMISYTSHQKDFTESYLIKELKKSGLKIWCEKPDGKQSSSAQELITCKVYLPIFCPESVCDDRIQDELALAYISNKSIIPIARAWFGHIDKKLTSGLKLMLAKINWTFFVKEKDFEETMKNLLEVLRTEVAAEHHQPSAMETEEEVYDRLNDHAPLVSQPDPPPDTQPETCEHTPTINSDFWQRHFTNKNEVSWTEFKDKFHSDYQERITRNLGEDRVKWITNILYRDILDLQKVVTKATYRKFVGKNKDSNPDEFYERLTGYACGSYAMREVFDMDSTVRLTAIQNLASFHTAGVITQLMDLVGDSDPNIRAVAALALAKTGKRDRRIVDRLIRLCGDEDRVVRESACLSLAHMKSQQAIPHIADLWRNDAIKHVREAAELALSRIGGEEAAKAMKVTQVLSQEMENLRSASKQ